MSDLSPVLQTDVRASGALGLAYLQGERAGPQRNANKRKENKGEVCQALKEAILQSPRRSATSLLYAHVAPCTCRSRVSFHQSIPHASTDCWRPSHDLGMLSLLIDENDGSPGTIAQAVAEMSTRLRGARRQSNLK